VGGELEHIALLGEVTEQELPLVDERGDLSRHVTIMRSKPDSR
jgi:hypothetical protein